MKVILSVALLGVVLGACGFHLRGTQAAGNYPPVQLQLAAGAQELENLLTQTLSRPDQSLPEVMLEISALHWSRNLSSVDQQGRPASYSSKLVLQTHFETEDGDRERDHQLVLVQEWFADPAQPHALEQKEQQVQEQLRRDAVFQLSMQLRSFVRAMDSAP